MGEGKRKAILQREIRAGKYQCVYCGGRVPATEPDHMPPRILFYAKDRPNDLIFPSCRPCNQGSKDLDQIVGWLSRIYPDPPGEHQEENRKLTFSIRDNYPEVHSALYPSTDPQQVIERRKAAVPPGTYLINLQDNYVQREVTLFGTKLGLALHWHATGRIVPLEGRVVTRWFTNFNAVANEIPSLIQRFFQNPTTLRQGVKHVQDQFEFETTLDEKYPRATLHVATLRSALMLVMFVFEARPDDPDFVEYAEATNGPGSFQGGYPYGMPRLSRDGILQRLARWEQARPTTCPPQSVALPGSRDS